MSKSAYSRLQFESDLDSGTVSTLVSLIQNMCYEHRSLYALKIVIFLRHSDYNGLLENAYCDPGNYSDAVSYLHDAGVSAIIRKFPNWPLEDINPTTNCIETFLACEKSCGDTNRAFARGAPFEDPIVSCILHEARSEIDRVLGPVPQLESLPYRFGPGSALNVKKFTSAFHKLKSSLDVTPSCVGLAVRLLSSCPGWLSCYGISQDDSPDLYDLLNIVPGGQLSSVTKNALTDRPILIEPLLNGLIQKSYGGSIRKRLKRAGWVDLNRAQSRHKRLARLASISGKSATVDVTSASDTISYSVVEHLLRRDWFEILDQCRSHRYTVGPHVREFEKFSSMGNGFTFELETLIFLALARAVCNYHNVPLHFSSCYGDDIILPTECYSTLLSVLTVCGFKVNDSKSFHEGPFRESCGGDYFLGTEVRPFFLKDELSPRTVTLWVNYLRRSGNQYIWPSTYKKLILLLKTSKFFNVGPDIGTDGHVVDIFFPAGREYNTMENVPRKKKHTHPIFLGAFALYRQSLMEDSHFDPRDFAHWYTGIERHMGFTPYKARNYKRKRRTHWGSWLPIPYGFVHT